MKNIFIEGIQGTGKSTLLNSIFSAVPEFHICREGDYSPIDLAWCAWMSKEEYEAVLECYKPIRNEIIKNTVQDQNHFVVSYTKIITDIPNFHREMEKYEVYNGRKTLKDLKEIIFSRYSSFSKTDCLFECSFFQNIIEDLILFHLLDDDEIVEFYRELYGQINQEHFQLLYLYSDKLEENIRAIKKERCDNLGKELWYPLMLNYLMSSPYGERNKCSTFEDMITHFKHRQQLELRIIREVIGDRAIILPAKDWEMDEIITLINLRRENMRRRDREVTDFKTILDIIDKCDIIRIGLADGDFPYIVPLNFAYKVSGEQVEFYVHGAKAGRKYELMNKNKKCSFEMDIPLEMDCIVEKKDVTMRYKCVMGTANITFLEGEEKQDAIDYIIMNRYEETRNFDYNRKMVPVTAVAKLTVIDVTAKVNPIGGGAD